MVAVSPACFDSQHEDIIHDAQFDYYGKRLATCSSDRTIRVFDVDGDNQTLLDTLKGHEGPVWAVAWAHPKYGSLIASASYDSRVIVWKETNGVFAKLYEHCKHSASVNSIAWAPHEYGLMLACGSSDGRISILSYKEDTSIWEDGISFTAHSIGVNTVAWAPASYAGALYDVANNEDNQQQTSIPAAKLASGGCDNLIKLWKFHKGANAPNIEESLEAHQDWVRDIAWAPNVGIPAQYLASCSQDKTVYVWTQVNPTQPFEKKKINTFSDIVWRVSWSLSGDVLAVSTGDNKVTLWREDIQGNWESISSFEE